MKNMGFIINEKTNTYTANIITVNGILTASQHQCISKAAELFGNGIIKLSTSFTIEVRGIPYEKINDFRKYIEKENLETGGVGPRLRPVVSCIGTDCRYGLTDTLSLSDEIHERIYNKYKNVQLPHRFKVAISGCPNDCTKINLCEIGIMSQYIPNFNEDKCKGCKKCSVEDICPMYACKVEGEKLQMDKSICSNCGRCVGKCYFDAIVNGTYGYKVFIGGKGGKYTGLAGVLFYVTRTFGILSWVLNKLFGGIAEVFDTVVDVVDGAIDKIKGFFGFGGNGEQEIDAGGNGEVNFKIKHPKFTYSLDGGNNHERE